MMMWLSNLRLSITQWALVSIAAVMGLLVVILRVQGSRLHQAQIDALTAGIRSTNMAEDIKLIPLKAQLEQEIQNYENAH